MTCNSRLTLPIETGMDKQAQAIMKRLGADAVRNSDGTDLPEWVTEEAIKVYSTYFCARGDEKWADQVPNERIRQFLMSAPTTAVSVEPLTINVMEGYLPAQFAPDLDSDREHYWQVIDRTTGEILPLADWSIADAPPLPLKANAELVGDLPSEARSAVVTIKSPQPFHVYTVNFLARQIWDSTQIYNYLTNEWSKSHDRVKERTYDVAYPHTWEHIQGELVTWLDLHPEVDVVRFTTFFYHFPLIFDDRAREKYVDWFGYSASVSVPALEEFALEYGYRLTAEDFVDAGYYNSPFRPPRKRFLDWIDFVSRRVCHQARLLVLTVHDAGSEAMMFLGDNWIGTEPYGPYFAEIGLDAVVGSVGSAATCRMISDIPGVRYREGRFLPYFFPDVFSDTGDPVSEARESWLAARRAIVRSPLDRIGYGGYLSLAAEFPGFLDQIEQIIEEFRLIHACSGGSTPANAKPVVAILNAWGQMRAWQTHMVAHALWNKQTYSYQGVIEALAGLPFEVRFISFDDVLNSQDVLVNVDVVINVGARGTAFSGGECWNNADLQQRMRAFVHSGGGLIGVGSPTASDGHSGSLFALADVLGVDQEVGWGLSTDRYVDNAAGSHFITADLPDDYDFGEDPGDIVPCGAEVVRESRGSIRIAVNQFGAGRAVYLAGLPYSCDNSRLLHRALMWAAGAEHQWNQVLGSTNPAVEVAWYPGSNTYYAYNNTMNAAVSTVSGIGWHEELHFAPMEGHWGVVPQQP